MRPGGAPARLGALALAAALAACGSGGGSDIAGGGDARRVTVALLDRPAEGAEPDAGCDALAFAHLDAVVEGDPLTAALRTLFALESESVRGHRNFLARTRGTLELARVERDAGSARIYLAGELSGLRGLCDDPRAAIQLRQTALRVPGVERVELYLNGEPTDLRPDARGRPGDGNGGAAPGSKPQRR